MFKKAINMTVTFLALITLAGIISVPASAEPATEADLFDISNISSRGAGSTVTFDKNYTLIYRVDGGINKWVHTELFSGDNVDIRMISKSGQVRWEEHNAYHAGTKDFSSQRAFVPFGAVIILLL